MVYNSIRVHPTAHPAAAAAPAPARTGPDLRQVFDVAVLGGGNAGLCAALSARARGATVLVLEGAPR